MTYNFTLTDSTALATVEPLESNGYGAQSVPRAVLDINFATPNSFVVADNVTARFTAGFIFNVITGPYDGTYTVDVGGSTYDLLTNTTTIPVTGSVVAAPLTINGVTTGVGGIWRIVGAINGDCVYYPGAIFNVVGAGLGDGAYTVVSSDVSGSYPLSFPPITGLGGTWYFSSNLTAFFTPGTTFRISSNNPGAGTYTVASSVFTTQTEVTVVETIPVTATMAGVGTITPAITLVTVATIPGGATPTGTASVPPSVAYTFAAPATGLTSVGPNTWQQIWHLNDLTGAVAAAMVTGCSVMVKNNSVFDNFAMTVISAVWDTVSITDVTVQYNYAGTPTLPDATGTMTYPLPPIPYGFIQYDMVADTSLSLVGRGSPAFNNSITWGQALQENDIHLLENFNNTTPPVAPIQGQLWFNQSTSTLFLFTSTIYNIENVNTVTDVGPDTWTIDGSFDKDGNSLAAIDLTTVFTPGLQFAVYNNRGIDASGLYSPTLVFEVLSSTNAGVGTDTTITINTTPSATPPFPIVTAAVPTEADTIAMPGAAPYGQLYAMTEWHQVAMLDDVFRLDPKASVKAATDAALPAYTATGSGPTRTLTATANAVLTVDGVATWTDMDNDGGSRFPGDPTPASRVLVKDPVGSADNGIYAVKDKGSGITPWKLIRAGDADNTPSGEVSAGMFAFVEEGALNLNSGWTLVTDNPIVIDVTGLTFFRFTIISEPNTQIVFGTGPGTSTTSSADFTFNDITDTVQIGAAGPGTITNSGGGTIVFNTGDITLTASNNDQIVLGASINITGADAAIGSTITISAGDSSAGGGGIVNVLGGVGSAASQGGTINIFAGAGTSGPGGDITVVAGSVSGGSDAGGNVTINSGTGTGTAAGGTMTLTAGQGGATGTGGNMTLSGGAGGSGSGAAGSVTVRGGLPTDGNGGAVTITGRSGVGTNRSGGAVTITAGDSTGTAAGANISVTAGASAAGTAADGGNSTFSAGSAGFTGGTGDGGICTVESGFGAQLGGNGGNLRLYARSAQGGNGNGGTVDVSAGQGVGTGIGGAIALQAGTGSTTGGAAGVITLQGGTGQSVATGGAITITGGSATGTGAGGTVTVQGGLPTTGSGGGVNILGRTAVGGNNVGGAIQVTGGTGTGTGTGGIIIITGGSSGSTAGAVAGGVSIDGGTGITSGAGGAVTISGGTSASTNTGGSVTVQGGSSATGGGGNVIITGRNASGAAQAGGVVTVTAGNASTSGTGGNITLTAGTGGTTGTAGTIALTGGAGGTTSGNGGAATLQGGLPVDGNGGGVTIAGRNGATITAANRSGGNVSINGGNATNAGVGGSLIVIAGTGGTTGIAGEILLQGGNGGSTSGNGGNVQLYGGTATAGSDDGNVIIGKGSTVTARDGDFLYIPVAAGTPTGTPNNFGNYVPIVFDTTNNKLYAYDTLWVDLSAGGAAATASAVTSTLTNGNAGSITIGQPVYVSAASTVDLGDASATATATPTIGLVFDASIATTASGRIITHGRISNANWTTATGAATLTTGSTYYLSETTGQITATAPVTVGSWVIPVGIALSTTDLLVNIGTPIQN